MDFNHYYTNEELETILNDWTHSHPGLFSLSTIGESFEKRPIWLATITNLDTGPNHLKPAIWIDANIHATELAGTTTALRVIHDLLTQYGIDVGITSLLDTSVYYVVPRLNPDGAALALSSQPRFVRSGVRLYPWEDKQEGLHAEDIDKDGRILQMRIVDPTGDWKVSSLDPRLLEKRSPDESGGTYYRLLPEGLVENFDGYNVNIARSLQGLDFNRNFPFEWRSEGDQSGAGPYPVSEAEIRAVVDFITRHNNIGFALTYHTYSRVVLRPYSTKADEAMDTNDLWVYKKLGEIGTKTTGYRCVSTFHDFKYHPKEVTTGAFDDWMFDHLGVYTFTIELWDLPTEAGIKDRKFLDWFRDHPHEDDLQILKWVDEHVGAGGYVDWYPFQHPQLGKIELGGWDHLFTWRNPPHLFLGSEAERNAPFPIQLGKLLPHLAIHSLDITPLGVVEPGTQDYRVNLVIDNTGFLPTYTSAQGKSRKASRPVRAELVLPDPPVRIVSGRRRVELGDLEGRSNKLEVTQLWGYSGTDNRARAEWVLRATPGTTIEVKIASERAGNLSHKFSLE